MVLLRKTLLFMVVFVSLMVFIRKTLLFIVIFVIFNDSRQDNPDQARLAQTRTD